MRELTIATESPLTAEGRALIDGSEAALREVYTPDECFSFTAGELTAPDTAFFVARHAGKPVGCAALVTCDGYGEIKRLYVPPEARGLGIAQSLMDHLESEARSAGITTIRLESGEKLAAAVTLYRARGYAIRGSFGKYGTLPASLFMEKPLR